MLAYLLPVVRSVFCFALICWLVPTSFGQVLPSSDDNPRGIAAIQTGTRLDWEGPVRVAVEDDLANGTSRTRTWIDLAGEPVELHLTGSTSALVSGSHVKLRGIRRGSHFMADLISAAPAAASLMPPCDAAGELKVAIVLLEMPGLTLLPETLTPSEIRDAFFSPTGASANTYLHEASYGKLSVSGDVYGPIQLDRDYDPASYILYFQDFIRAADATVDFRKYNRIAFVWPTLPGWSGLTGEAEVGCQDLTSPTNGQLNGAVVTILPGSRLPAWRFSRPMNWGIRLASAMRIRWTMRHR